MSSLKDIIKMLPNNVSGDGKVYASTLKKVLNFFGEYINSNVDEKLDQLGDGAAANVTGLKLTETHTTDSNGMPQNNIIVEYDNTNVENFLHCQIWMKTDDDDSIWAQQGTASGVRYIIEGVQTGTTYIVKAVSVNKQGGTSAFADSPTAQITIKGSQLVPDAPKQFVLTWDARGALWEWLQDDNGYIDYFELRLDGKAGEWNDNLLDVTRNNFSRANPKVRSGTAYLFTRNVFGTYSLPATLIFSKPVAAKPNPPKLSPSLKGINISMDTLPDGYTGYKLLINDVEFTTTNSEYLYFQFSGTCTVKYCFVDVIGDGEYSDAVTVEIKTVLDLVELPTIDRTKIDESIKNALEIADAQPDINDTVAGNLKEFKDSTGNALEANATAINQNAESITALAKRVTITEGGIKTNTSAITQNAESITGIVSELNSTDPSKSNYSAFVALADAIELRVMKDGIISAINLSPELITIDGKFLHITGTTLIDNNVIVGGNIAANSITSAHIQANAITADKIDADAIHVGGANGNVTITPGALVVDGEEGNVTITPGAIKSDALATGSVIADKISAGAVSTEKLAAEAISLTGALSIVGGAVELSEEGLRLTANDNSYTLFNGDGINYVDKNGVVYAQVKKIIIGKAYDGQYIRFSAPWESVPSVITVPMSIRTNDVNYQASTTTIVCEATEVSQNGFRVNNYLKLAGGSYAVIDANKTETLALNGLESMTQYGYGRYTYHYTMAIYSNCLSISIPSTANYLEVSLNISSINQARNDRVETGYPGANSGVTWTDSDTWYIKAELIVNDSVVATVSYSTTSGNHKANTILSASFSAGVTSAFVRVTYTGSFSTNDHGSWSTIYDGWTYIAKAVFEGSKITMPYYKYSASESKIAQGYAMFLVTDGSTNTYTIE